MFSKITKNALFVTVLLVLGSAIAFSSEKKPQIAQPLQHQKRFYFSPDGRFFVPADMKLFLKVSSSPAANAPSAFLKSRSSMEKHHDSEKEATPLPFMFEKGGQHKIVVLSGKGKNQKKKLETEPGFGNNHQLKDLFYVILDNKPPTSSAIISSAPMITLKQAKVYGKPVQFRLKTADNASGLQGTFFSVDGTNFNEYLHPLTFSQEKHYDFRFYSADNVGNAEALKHVMFSIDLTPPSSSYKVSIDHNGNVLSPRTKLRLQSTDNNAGVSKIYYGFDTNKSKIARTHLVKKIALTHLKEGNHSFVYYAKDRVNNTENKKLYEFYLDKTPPAVTVSIQGDRIKGKRKTFVSKRTSIKINASDNKSGLKNVKYSLDLKKTWQLYRAPFSLPQKQGLYYLKYYANDIVNNKSTIYTHALYQDLMPPETQYDFKGHHILTQNQTFVSSQTFILLKSSDKESGVQTTEYIIDNKKEERFSKPIQLHGEGHHQLTYYSKDQVNNTEEKKTAAFIVYNIPPILFTQFSIGHIGTKTAKNVQEVFKVYPSQTMMFLGATDQSVGLDRIEYKINNNPSKLFTSTLKFDKTGEYNVLITAFDKLQNKKTKKYHFFIE